MGAPLGGLLVVALEVRAAAAASAITGEAGIVGA